ncbi:hypothetical protein [Sphingomonas sp. BAUL-RG-20F-R05-02]|uniref:hypothetical protein n=1 Tax=Sphingomonas sp. BAUL-RG-20F-R05-02 TaxID=2914830 RepID=UPI001F597CAC|nr:hypothetical protein [Sphingomonas sp. BAUL-RG-20F-R05-02]
MEVPGMVWRSANLTTVYLTVLVPAGWDTVALVENNMRSSDTWRIRAASTEAATTSGPTYDSGTLSAWSGAAPANRAMSLVALPTARTETYVRIDITSTGNPDGFVQAQRLVIGKRLENVGADLGVERSYEDTSNVEDGPGYMQIDRFNVRTQWKFTISDIKEADWEGNWAPFLKRVGVSRSFLFVEDSNPAFLNSRSGLVRSIVSAKGAPKSSDFYVLDMTVKTVS